MRKVAQLPPSGVGKYERDPKPEHVQIVRRLNADPGAWFELKTFNTKSAAGKYATSIRQSQFVAFRGKRYEATVRGTTVHARVVD